ncbi:hypothetical protein PVAND_007290 [Polypedilum vanderplanki]|uniref:DDE-1 domain-containing protein n=1 Tax=Polypedilum vanderplanki TaxID=319348 RepID=A0A9J6C679_POLVA|nr:hypothetical protein PVAND_007290 [Polypedilum vanderplanki]
MVNLYNNTVLFSKLKNLPNDLPKEKNFTADVNETGMWSTALLESYLQNVIYKRKETSLLRQPVLLILDSFASHIKVATSKKFERGNTKVPSHKQVAQWIVEWSKNVSIDLISNAFSLCGIGSCESFNEENLHTPLKNLIQSSDDDSWIRDNSEIFVSDNMLYIDEEEYYFPPSESNTSSKSFFICIYKFKEIKESFAIWIRNYCKEIIERIKLLWNIEIDEVDAKTLSNGNLLGNNLDIHAISDIEDILIDITVIDEESMILENLKFESSVVRQKLELVCLQNYYIMKKI